MSKCAALNLRFVRTLLVRPTQNPQKPKKETDTENLTNAKQTEEPNRHTTLFPFDEHLNSTIATVN